MYNCFNKRKKYPLIILIPTIHTSRKSSLFIYNLFKQYLPTDIAIEYCPERFFKKKICHDNYITYILYLLLLNIQEQLSSIYNEVFGVDIIKSIFLSEKYNCNLYLIDKKITSTFKSLSKKISLIEIFYLLFIFLNLKYSKKLKLKLKSYYDDIENKNIKMIDKIILFIKKNVPSYYQSIILERNDFMIYNILKIILNLKSNQTLFIIVGYGHYEEIYSKLLFKKL